MGERLTKRVLLIGWDAADWKLINALLALDRLPGVRKLIEGGASGELRTLDPKLSPLLWTSIATGKRADKHGILNFVEADPSGRGLRLSTSTSRKTKALWNILTQSGLKTNVVGWYASHPAEPVSGVVVSNLFFEGIPPTAEEKWPLVGETVHPAELADRIDMLRLHPHEIDPQTLTAMIPQLAQMNPADKRLSFLVKLLAQAASIQNIATSLLSEGPDADCTMVFQEAIDVAGHHFMQYFPPKMAHVPPADFDQYQHVMYGIYQIMDLMLVRLLELAGPETTVILLSDHGFHSDHLRPPVPPSIDDVHAAMDASWHRPLGVLMMAGPGIAKGKQVHGATLLDIAPTILTLLGLPVGADMDGRVLVEAFEKPPQVERVFSWDMIEGESGMHPADKRMDPADVQQSIKQLVDLGYLANLPSDVQQQLELVDRETKFNLGIVFMTAGKPAEAAEVFAALTAHSPGEPRYAINFSQCLYQLGRFGEARAVLERLLQIHPDHPDAKIFLGAAMIAEGRPMDAVPLLEEARVHASYAPDRDVLLGTAYRLVNRNADAREAFTRAVKVDPHNPRAHHGLAWTAMVAERFEEAVEHALEAVQLQHHFPEGHYTLGVALTWMRDYPKAIQCFNIALSMQPGYLDVHRYLASIYRHKGDYDNARRHRVIAEDLIAQRKAGGTATGTLSDEPPMGPADWLKTIGEPEGPPANS